MFCLTTVDFSVFVLPLNYKFVAFVYRCVLLYLKDHDEQLQDYTMYIALFPGIPQSQKLLGRLFH
jgi:hypothetical protein